METPNVPLAVVSFTLDAAAHMLRSVELGRGSMILLREIAPLLDNGTIIFGNKELPAKLRQHIAAYEKLQQEVKYDSPNQ